jgi:hypothetical protein
MAKKIQTTKLIHVELKNGDFYKYLWLGNDDFADLWNDWDFESDEGKYKGLYDFDLTFSFTIEMDEIKNEESIIGMSFDTDLEDSEIVDFTLEEVIWEETTYTVDIGSINIDEEQYQQIQKIGFDKWISKNIDFVELDQIHEN